MRYLSIQVQPERSPGIDMARVTEAFQRFADIKELVKHHAFENGFEDEAYFNYTFETPKAIELWTVIREQLYCSMELGVHLRNSSIAVCSSETGWDAYSQWFHFDPSAPLELPAA